MFVTNDPLGQPGRPAASVEPDDHAPAAEARLQRQVHLGHVAALAAPADRRAPGPRHRRRPDRPALVDGAGGPGRHRLHQGDRPERQDLPAQDRDRCPRSSSSGRSRSGATPSSATGPAPTSRRTPRRAALYFAEQAMAELHAGRTRTWTDFKVPDEAIGCGFHEAVRGVLSHHVVIRDGKIANYHPYPPTPWNASPRDIYGTPGPYEDAVQNTPDLRGERARQVQGHRHHARGAQLRPVPALRRPHVPGQRQDCSTCGTSRCSACSNSTRRRSLGGRKGGGDDDPRRPRVPGAAPAARHPLQRGRAPAPTPRCRPTIREIVQAVLDLHGAGLERILGHVDRRGRGRRRDPRRLRPRRGGRRPAPAPRPAPPGPGDARAPGAGPGAARISARTAATSSCSASRMASFGCG